MSPLIATILLILFAVSLGVLILTFGNQLHKAPVVSEEDLDFECKRVNIEVARFANSSSLCYDGENIHFTAQNKGFEKISSLKMIAIGDRSLTKNLDGLSPNVPLEYTVEFPILDFGPLSELHLVPRVTIEDKEFLCMHSPLINTQIGSC